MKVKNPFKMNDWDIKSFLIVIFSIQLIMWGSIGLDLIGLKIPILRQLIGFMYLTLVPGVLILRILNLHEMNTIETLMYTIGLSLFTLMFMGFGITFLYPYLGISKPFSSSSFIITISLLVLFLGLLCYILDSNYPINIDFIDSHEVFSSPVLFLLLIPFLSIFGTYYVNYLHDNIILMLMIVVVSSVTLFIGWDKFIPEKLYPLALWSIMISLVWHNTLISKYINIYDVAMELYQTNLIINNSYWDWTTFNNYNSILSNVVLGPIYYHVCNLELTLVFKIIYPLFFSFVPVGLYNIYQNNIKNNKISFLACFLFLSINPVYNEISSTTKQSTAEFFLVGLLMLLFNKDSTNKVQKTFLTIVFGTSLAVSHYGTSYLLAGAFIFVSLLYFIQYYLYPTSSKSIISQRNQFASRNFIFLYLVFTISWYMFLSSSSSFITLVNLIHHVTNTIFTDFLNPETSRGYYALVKPRSSILSQIYKYFHISIQFLITIGLFSLLSDRKSLKFDMNYVKLSLYFFLINVAAITLSGFAVMNAGRLYHISLFFLAPFSILGMIFISKKIYSIFNISWTLKTNEKLLKISSVFFILYLLFNTGFISEIYKESFNSISISQESILNYGDENDISKFYFRYIPENDVFSARWLSINVHNVDKIHVYATLGHGEGGLVLAAYGMIPLKNWRMLNKISSINKGDYIYLHYVNLVHGLGFDLDVKLGRPVVFDMKDISHLIESKNKIYDNGGSEILLR